MENNKLKVVFNPETTGGLSLKEVRENYTHQLRPSNISDWSGSYNIMWSAAHLNKDGNVEVLGSSFATCKDYLLDAAVNNRSGSIGYFTPIPGGYMNTTPSVMLLFLNKKAKEAFLSNIKLLHAYEKRLRYKRTQFFEVDLHENLLFVTGSTMWAYNSVLMSMWLTCLRMCTLAVKEPPQTFRDILDNYIGKESYKINELRWGELFFKNIDLVLTNARKFNEIDLRDSKEWGKNGFGKPCPDSLHGSWGIYNTMYWCQQQAALTRQYKILKYNEAWQGSRVPVITEMRVRFVEIMDKILGFKCVKSISEGILA